jgi:flagellar biosynthesis/type III secretory pathway protein FliH
MDLALYRPDGRRFETFVELDQSYETERQRAETERQRAETERQRAETERQRAETERQRGREEGLRQALERLIASGMVEEEARRLLGLE